MRSLSGRAGRWLVLSFCLVLGAAGAWGQTKTCTVTSTSDASGAATTAGTLRYCLSNLATGSAVGTNTINITATGTILLSNSLPTISQGVTIQGPTSDPGIAISGGNSYGIRIFTIGSGASVTLKNLTIENGSADNGGGIDNSGNLKVIRCTISGNNGITGGGIYNAGVTYVLDSTISGNNSQFPGGGINSSAGTLTVLDSTISGNIAEGVYLPGIGGGLYLYGTSADIDESTISDNGADAGGGIDIYSGQVTLTNSIVSGNASYYQIQGNYTNGGGNVVGDTKSEIDLATLGNYGGPTQTMPPLKGSPALEKGIYHTGEPTADQRGYPRPSTNNAVMDSGSVEVTGAPPAVLSVSPQYGPTSGGAAVTITATGMDGATAGNTLVDFGNYPGTVTSISPASSNSPDYNITAISPVVNDAGPVNVTLTYDNDSDSNLDPSAPPNEDTSAITPNDVFTYETPNFGLTATLASSTFTPPGTDAVTLQLTPVNEFRGSVAVSCSSTPAVAKCPGLPTTQFLSGESSPTIQTGVQFKKNTPPGAYVVTFTATDTANAADTNSQTVTIDVK